MEVCIPFYLDTNCLRASLDAVKRFVKPNRVLVNNASPEIDITQICENSGLSYTITKCARIQDGVYTDHCGCLDLLFSKTESDTVLVLDQDCLLTQPITPLLKRIEKGTVLLGPLDLYCATGEHIKGQKIHNFVSRLTPLPGYIHACFMLMNAKVIREKFGTMPFRFPSDVKPFGYGILGAEPYYGLTYYCRKAELPIDFMFMLPGCYGICAELAYDNFVYAVHLWYSSRVVGKQPHELLDYVWKDGTIQGQWLNAVEVGWLQTEKQRFLQDYWSNKLKIKWGMK